MTALEIIIDYREHALCAEIGDRDLDKYTENICIRKDNLELGDIHIKYGDLFYLFERKTVPDLISSIKDGRYKEQKARLLSNVCKPLISYIIEGDNVLATQSYNANKSILLGVYLHTLFRDNIRILFTKNIAETATLILTIATKIIDNPEKFTISVSEEYTDVLKLKKKKIDNIDERACFIMQLSQIPTISNIIAKSIASVYPNMKSLIQSLEDCSDKEALLCKIDKIGKEKANKILTYLGISK